MQHAQTFIFDAQSYLNWEEKQTDKHEFMAGEVFARVGARCEHVIVSLKSCKIFKAKIGFCKMRLTQVEQQKIHYILDKIDPDSLIYLFGSRVDDSKKGGDIDIFLETNQIIDLKTKLKLEYQLGSLCDTKVDLLIKTPEQMEQPIFSIARQGILL